MKTGTIRVTLIKSTLFLFLAIGAAVDTLAHSNSVFSLPKIQEFKGNSDGNLTTITWKLDVSSIDLSGKTYTCELQRAGEGNQFITIEAWEKLNVTDYSYNGQLLTNGRSLYRLRLTSSDGEVWLSNVLSFYKGTNTVIKDLKVYPTVISYNQFTINIPSERKQQGTIQMVNYAGQVVYEKQLMLNAGTISVSISDFNPSLHGNHILVVRTGGEHYRAKIIIQNTNRFVK